MAFLTSPILPLPPMGATLSSSQGSEYLMILNPMDKIVLFTFNSFEIRQGRAEIVTFQWNVF